MPKSSAPQPRRPSRSITPASPQPFTPAAVRVRHDGWTPARQIGFIEALAQSGCVEEACRSVGISKQSAYRLKMRPDAQAFRMAWEAALDFAVRRLTDECLGRAMHGEEVPHYYQGELVGTHRRYDNKLAMFLMRYRDPLRYAASLDQMVYSGHPEGAALRFAQAVNRVSDEAHGFVDEAAEPFDADPMPWTTQELTHAREEAQEEAMVAGNAPVHGTAMRKMRIQQKRQERAEQERRARQADPEWKARFAEAQRRWDALDHDVRRSIPRPTSGMEDKVWDRLLEEHYDPDRRAAAAVVEIKSAEAPVPTQPVPPASPAMATAAPVAPPPGRGSARAAMPSRSSPSVRTGPRCTLIEAAPSPFARIAGGLKVGGAGG